MKKIYLIMGSAGEWSDFRTWVIRIFESEILANEYLRQLKRVKEFMISREEAFLKFKELRVPIEEYTVKYEWETLSFTKVEEDLDDRTLPEQWLTDEEVWVRDLGKKESDVN